MSVVVEEYNPEWPEHFDKIKSELQSFLEDADIISIEHVGSTSVPGLAAKPIIDVDIIATRENIQSAIDALVAKGNFIYLGELGIIDRHALYSPDQKPSRNIYVCVDGTYQTRNHLSVRDTLRSDPALREEYGSVKLQLAERGLDIVDYVEAKSNILIKILQKSGVMTEEELDGVNAANKKGERHGAIMTERLTLREFVMKDVTGFHALESIPEVVRYQSFPPRTMEQSKKEVVTIIQNSAVTPREHVELAVLHEGKFIGRVGAKIKRKNENGKELEPPHADLWFSFMPEMHGRGFATEAMKAFISLLGNPMKLEIECDPRNMGSSKMAERLGFERVSLTEMAYESKEEWVDSLVYQKDV
ncbi:UPF0157-domain-containing protein [Zopfia rhizophila CBS 207.26]|uniref:UPF0157-domain-containing protein n=1 Tax=Zopfia rhizophila CBS 207.26 TaxID=1314779 RepID=A0A6A6DBU7_9PEZI|nr:UPF0157-domain-containing protein [Zopfia rhizophila CBS 207.26]